MWLSRWAAATTAAEDEHRRRRRRERSRGRGRRGGRSGGCAACHYHSAESVCALEAGGATRRFPCCGEIKHARRQSALCRTSAAVCLDARAAGTVLISTTNLVTLPAPPSCYCVCRLSHRCVLSVLSVRCGGCSLGPLSVDRMCDCVPASLSESVSTRTATECACMPERNPVSRRFIHAVTIGAPRRLLSPPCLQFQIC
jgi:hypothetical protein